jgi:6-pyruvoyl-tetrahydropterin synthase
MFSVRVREHMMVAHSLKGEIFGPAQQLHGATYVVDMELSRPRLSTGGIVVDIDRALNLLKRVLAEFNYKNLDDVPALAGVNTTTEVMAHTLFERLRLAIAAGELGPGSEGLSRLKLTLHESHIAAASFEGAL